MSKETFTVVGKAVERQEAALKATGSAEYSGDHYLPGLLTAKVLRSPHPHARIVSIDTSRAQAMDGVVAVATAADLPKVRTGRWLYDRSVFAWDEVRHIGDAVAAVAAVDEETAEEALELIRVEYEPLPAVFDPLKAMESDSALVHKDLASYPPPKRKSKGNILNSDSTTIGDVESAFARADLVYECRYTTPLVHPGFTQPHQCVANPDASGKLTLWTSTKDPFRIRQQIREVLGLPMSRIRVIAGWCGGDFGGKGTITTEGICACLALKAKKPVRLTLTWQEEFSSTFSRTRTITDIKTGIKKDGTLLAIKARVVHDCGAYMDAIASNLNSDMAYLQGPYRCPNVDLSAFMVYTNNPPTGHVRGVRCPQEHFATESHIDTIARKLGLDPLEIRLRNAMRDGDVSVAGGVLRSVSATKVLEATAKYMKKQSKSREPHTGWGFALGQYNLHTLPGGIQSSSACVKVNEDGTVTLLTGSSEQGAGILTVLQQIVAEELGVSMDSISAVSADTDASPWERGTGGSQTTYRVGPTVQMAAQDAREQLLVLASRKLEAEPDKLGLAQGKVFLRSNPNLSVSLKELATEALSSRGGPIIGTGLSQRKERLKKIEAEKGIIDGPSYGVAAVKVAVDPDTGQVRVLQCYSVWDAGFAINPDNVTGQMEGGVAYGLGYALTEEMVTREGRTLNNNLMDYHMPTFADVPMMDMEIVEVPSGWGPHGAKGFAEGVNAPVAPAVANAVYEATGARVTDIPLTPERVFNAMKAQKST